MSTADCSLVYTARTGPVSCDSNKDDHPAQLNLANVQHEAAYLCRRIHLDTLAVNSGLCVSSNFTASIGMENLEGNYTHKSSEGYDNYLKEVGVPWMLRKMILSTGLVLEITRTGEEWTLAYKTSLKTTVFEFRLY